MTRNIQDRRRLVAAAKELAELLRQSDHEGVLRVAKAWKPIKARSDGWKVRLGSFGRGLPYLELWMDDFTMQSKRVLWACVYSSHRAHIQRLTAKVSQTLMPVRTLTYDDIDYNQTFRLKKSLARSLFGKPIAEHYQSEHFFGIYDRSRGAASAASIQRFCHEAAAFFFQVAESLPKAKKRQITRHDYPRCENRERVVAHVNRERSSYLAQMRKDLDGYVCQICAMNFAKVYGKKLGACFAEAHHKQALSTISGPVMRSVDDLITVCANCHRMLHRMDGKPGDIGKLKAIVRKHQKTSKR